MPPQTTPPSPPLAGGASRQADCYKDRFQNRVAAEKYAHRFEHGGRRRINRSEQKAVRSLLRSLPERRSILDVPAGAGRFLATLSEGGARLICADVSMEILELARERAAALGVTVEILEADARSLPLPDGSVDMVFCNRLLHHLLKPEERAAVLRELRRVSRRHLVVSFFNYHKFGVLRLLAKRLKGRRPNYQGQPTAVEFREELRQAGFKILAEVAVGPFWSAQMFFVLEKV